MVVDSLKIMFSSFFLYCGNQADERMYIVWALHIRKKKLDTRKSSEKKPCSLMSNEWARRSSYLLSSDNYCRYCFNHNCGLRNNDNVIFSYFIPPALMIRSDKLATASLLKLSSAALFLSRHCS